MATAVTTQILYTNILTSINGKEKYENQIKISKIENK